MLIYWDKLKIPLLNQLDVKGASKNDPAVVSEQQF